MDPTSSSSVNQTSADSVIIRQIYYKRFQTAYLDPQFEAYSNIENRRPEWREYWIFRSEYLLGRHKDAALVGYVSWKFNSKTGISGQQFENFVRENPGYDVYFINPFPLDAFLFKNVWHQAEIWHPGLSSLAQRLVTSAGQQISLMDLSTPQARMSFCNFWVARPSVWEDFMNFMEPFFQHVEGELTTSRRVELLRPNNTLNPAPTLSYISERMFSTFLTIRPEWRCLSYEYSQTSLERRYGKALMPYIHDASILGRVLRNQPSHDAFIAAKAYFKLFLEFSDSETFPLRFAKRLLRFFRQSKLGMWLKERFAR